MSIQEFLFLRHSTPFFVGISFLLSFISLSAIPNFITLVLLIAASQIYARVTLPRPGASLHAFLLWLSITLGVTSAHALPSLNALSSSVMSLLIMGLLSGMLSAVALGAIYLDTRLCLQMKQPWAQITLFPAMWATVWCGVSHVSPVGRLVTWSPVVGTEAYDWTKAYSGPVGIDWITGAWAVVCAQAVGMWFVGPDSRKDSQDEHLISHELLVDVDSPSTSDVSSKPHHAVVLAALLLALAIPSYVMSDLPVPPSSLQSTPLTVGCVLPSPLYSKLKSPNTSYFDEYLATSKKMTAANLILWPEGAVHFDNPQAREAAIEKVRTTIHGPWVGIAFEESIPLDDSHDDGRVGKKRNGVTLVGPEGPVMTYFKRNLVPIAESFSMTPSREPPSICTLDLPNPEGMTKPDWNPETFTRPVTVTASVCLDFSSPSAFSALESRPSIILAPGRTWHPAVGVAMWEQAKMRASEIGSTVLWCDGGEGGVSGVSGRGMNDIMQIGDGYWMRKIGLPWPYDDTRTVYARIGDLAAVVFFWVILISGRPISAAFAFGDSRMWTRTDAGWRMMKDRIQHAGEVIREWRNRRRSLQEGERGERELLL